MELWENIKPVISSGAELFSLTLLLAALYIIAVSPSKDPGYEDEDDYSL